MRILFVVNRLAHVRHFDRAVRLLADRGHDVCLASQDDDVELWGVLARQPRIRAVVAPRNRGDDWGAVLQKDSPLTACVTQAVDTLRESGELQRITDEWIGAEAPELQ